MNAKHYLIHFYSLYFVIKKKHEILDKLSSSLCVQVNDLNTRRNSQQIKQINVTKKKKTIKQQIQTIIT